MTTRILHYNWAQFDDPGYRGGGVSVYLRNLLAATAKPGEVDYTILSAGHHYTFFDRRCRYEETQNQFAAQGVRSFQILNSPVKAPAHDMFYDMETWRSDRKIAEVFAQVLRDQGPFDQVILHSLEGLSSEVLALPAAFPHTRFVYMWHNYMPICPQIELMWRNEEDCQDFEDGRKCQGCLMGMHQVRPLIGAQRLGTSLERARLSGMPLGNFIFGTGFGLLKIGQALRDYGRDLRHNLRHAVSRDGQPKPGRGFQSVDLGAQGPRPEGRPLTREARGAGEYSSWRAVNLGLFKDWHAHFAVSQQVADTIAPYGVERDKLHVTPLGMDLHATPEIMRKRAQAKRRDPEKFRLSFIGYGIPSKGLPFLTKSLIQIPAPILREKVELTIFARLSEHDRLRLTPLENHLAGLRVVDGYERRDLAKIASGIDLNIVPSIWRETFNQVTFELLCLGTPSLLSSSVGLGMVYEDKDDFIFKSGDSADLVAKLSALVESPGRLARFWDRPPVLPSMQDHFYQMQACLRQTHKEPQE